MFPLAFSSVNKDSSRFDELPLDDELLPLDELLLLDEELLPLDDELLPPDDELLSPEDERKTEDPDSKPDELSPCELPNSRSDDPVKDPAQLRAYFEQIL